MNLPFELLRIENYPSFSITPKSQQKHQFLSYSNISVKVIQKHVNFPKNSQRIPKEFPKNFQIIPKEFPKNSQRIPKELPKNSQSEYNLMNSRGTVKVIWAAPSYFHLAPISMVQKFCTFIIPSLHCLCSFYLCVIY